MNTSIFSENQFLATKFFVPVVSHGLIPRPRLYTLLDKSLKHPLTLVSAAAGFGKTTLLSTWVQSLPANHPSVAWITLDEEDNEPKLFWSYVLSALNKHQSQRLASLLMQLQSPQALSLKRTLTALINLLAESPDPFVLILDDYQLITEPQVHTTLAYFVQHLPAQLHIILSTRADPPLPFPQLQAYGQILEVRTDQLRCTVEETKAFFHQIMRMQLHDEVVQEVTARTEGWLVGLQLLGFSLQEHTDPATLLEEATGDQRYILDYLTEEVLRRQPDEVQTFLLCTCILERFTANLCEAVVEQPDSQRTIRWLEQANLFLVSLDSRRMWYRYHALFAQALRYQLEQENADLVPVLHARASRWYAEHGQFTNAILHAFSAHQWEWAADLIECSPLMSFTWGAAEHELVFLRRWLEQLPSEVVHARPRLCLACAQLLWAIAPYPKLEAWLSSAEARLTASLAESPQENLSSALYLHQKQQKADMQFSFVSTCLLDNEMRPALLFSSLNRLARR